MAFWNAVKSWLKNYGFAVLVFVALASATFIAINAEVPDEVPDFALNSKGLYRLEVGGASFAILYIGILALVLALHGRGFTQIGRDGVQAEWVVTAKQQKMIKGQEDNLKVLKRNIEKATMATRLMNEEVRQLKEWIAQWEEDQENER